MYITLFNKFIVFDLGATGLYFNIGDLLTIDLNNYILLFVVVFLIFFYLFQEIKAA